MGWNGSMAACQHQHFGASNPSFVSPLRCRHSRSSAARHHGNSRGTGEETCVLTPRLQAAWKVTRWYWAIMGVCPDRSAPLAMSGELSFCINDLAECRGDLKEDARLIRVSYRGATSAEGSVRKIMG